MLKTTVYPAIAVFLVAELLSLRLNGMADGYTTAGFPVIFLKYSEGKCVACDHFLRLPALVFDLAIAFLVSVALIKIWKYASARKAHPGD